MMHSSPSSLDSPDDGMGDGSSRLLKIIHSSPREEPSQPEEPKGGAFSTEGARGRNLLKSEVRIGNIVGDSSQERSQDW